MTTKPSSTGSRRTFATARDEMRRFSSSRPGAQPHAMIGPSCLRLQSWQARSGEPRNSHLNHHSRAVVASRRYAACGRPALAVVHGVASAREGVPANLALPAFLQSYVANLVTAGVRLIPLGQTDGQRAIAALEQAVFAAAEKAMGATIEDLGSAAFTVDLASMKHETQYTRLFRS